jgi:arginyl-tRNA synthetase
MIKDQLVGDLQKAIKSLGFKASDIVVSISEKEEFGDYTTNSPLQLAKQNSQNRYQSSLEIAKAIIEKLGHPDYLERVDIAGPGFLNFFIKPEIFAKEVDQLTLKNLVPNLGENKKVILEHTSVNPNKAMHIGHLRNAVIGDSLVRTLRKIGYQVQAQNYIDDTGVQVTDTFIAKSQRQKLGIREKEETESLEDYYWDIYSEINRLYQEKPELLKVREEVMKEVEEGSNQTASGVKEVAVEMTKAITQLLATFDIYHDLLVWESDILKIGLWKKAFDLLITTQGFEKETEGKNKGTWLVRFGEGGDDEHTQDKIFVRSNGTATYTAKDFAYNLWKFGLLPIDFTYQVWEKIGSQTIFTTDPKGHPNDQFKKSDLVYTVIDQRQSYVQEVIKELLERLNFSNQAKNFRHVSYGVVSLSANTAKALGIILEEGKNTYAMSGRKGIGIKVRDLQSLLVAKLEEEKPEKLGNERGGNRITADRIANCAIKYYMLKYNSNSEIVFDFDQALSVYGATGPYLQYTYARVWGILEKAKDLKDKEAKYTPNSTETHLIKKMLEWSTVLTTFNLELEPVTIANYAYELAQSFNSFYEKNQVVMALSNERAFRVELVKKFEIIFKDVLDSLGIEAPERM